MVGVAGRSRGCKTCRRRRVKCDEHHPTCKRCAKAGYTCEGYQDRNFIIFDNTIKHENAIQSYKSSKDSDTNSETSEPIIEITVEAVSETSAESVIDFNSLTPIAQSTELLRVDDRKGSPLGGPSILLSPIVDRADLYASFMYKYFYRGAAARINLFAAPGADIKTSSSLSAMSAGALATSFFGFKTGTHAIMIDGQKKYGTALAYLNRALSHRSPKDDCDVLAAIVMLCLYEFMMPASMTGWISHALGLGSMFKILGPELCSQHPYHTYFQGCRILIVYAQLTLRLDSFLADKKWLTIPWLTRTEGKTSEEQMCDIIAKLCRLQKSWDDVIIQKDLDQRQRYTEKYLKQLDHCFAELQIWAEKHKADAESERILVPHHTIGTILDDQAKERSESTRPALFEYVYSYPDLESASLVCLYHAVSILLTLFVHNPPPPTFVGYYPAPAPAPPKDSAIHMAYLASGIEIAKSTDFHLQEHQDSAGSFHLVFPMRMAIRAFEVIESREEEKWANGILTGIGKGANRQWAFAGQVIRENGQDVHNFRK